MSVLDRYPRWVLTIAAVLYLLPGIAELPLVDRDEPRFSRATVEMMERENWVVPYFNGDYRFDKPPLTYWWMSLHYRIFGVTELGARMHSVVAAWLTSLIIFGIGRRMGLTERWALLAGFVWLTSLQVLIHGRVAVADMPLILGVTLAMRGFWEYLFGESPPGTLGRWFWYVYLGMAFAFLAKGPLALLIPGLSLGLLFAFSRGRGVASGRWRKLALDLVPGAAVFLGIIGAWGIPALVRTDGAYFDVGIGEHVVERGFSSFNERLFIPGVYYLVAVLIFFSPWVATLWPSIKMHWRARRIDAQGLFLLGWAASSFLIFSFYKTQLPHYILLSYPALALMAAAFLRSGERPGFQLTVWINRVVLGVGIAAVFTVAIAITAQGSDPARPIALALIVLAIALSCLLLASEAVKRRRFNGAAVISVFGALCFYPLATSLRSVHLTVRLQNVAGNIFAEAENAYDRGYGEPSLVWYSGRIWDRGGKHLDGVELGPDDVVVFNARRWRLDEDMIGAFLKGAPIEPMHDRRDQLETHFPGAHVRYVQGFSPGNSSWLELAVVTRPKSVEGY